ncbi:MAG TPA: hypothetical protein VKS81_06845, partial [Bacteroidota bacterium]|nr:hypothetical protein [Bacteroidota bacterium]
LATATVPGTDVTTTGIEYYFILKPQSGDSVFTYPSENPTNHPLRIEVMPALQKDNAILFLSPDPSSSTSLEDLVISVSLIKADSTIDRKGTKIFIDDRDVSGLAVLTGDLITLTPENITPPLPTGPHVVRIELYSTDGKLAHKSSIAFTQTSMTPGTVNANKLQYNLNGTLENRNEKVSDVNSTYNRGLLNLTSQYDWLQVNGKLYLTNEDVPSLQPQNRYYIEGKTSWLKVGFGDAFPIFPSLIMDGKRLRGLTADLTLGGFNLDYASGEVTRKVDGDTIHTFSQTQLVDSVRQDSILHRTNNYGPYNADSSVWAQYKYGTFARTLTVIRPSFGSGQSFQWGFSYLKSKDDVTSILYGSRPAEDIAVGTDMLIGFDNRHVLLTGQYGASVRNTDISSGNITDSQIDSLFTGSDSANQRSNFKKIRDLVSHFITVNQNIVPLGIDKLSSIMAYEAAGSVDYFDNYLKGTYIYHGSQYNSFGQTYLRQDVQGFNVFDRIRLIQNQVFFSLGFERLQDNTDQSKLATTTFTNTNFTLSYFPRTNFPNITIGYGTNAEDNGLINDSAYATSAIKDQTNRFYVQANYDFTAGLRHSASFNVSTSSRDDQTITHANSKNTTITLALTTNWTSPLQTSVGLSVNLNQLPGLDTLLVPPSDTLYNYNYETLLIGAKYRMMDNKLTLAGMVGPTLGVVKRTLFDFNAEYQIEQQVSIIGDLNLLANNGSTTDVVSSLMLRYSF